MQATGPRGSIGKASYEAVRKHIDEGKKATEAFRLVAEETGRSTATVQTAYYRVARSLPDGGGVQLRPRKKAASRRGAKAAGASSASTRRGRPPKKGSSATSGTAASRASSPTRARTARGSPRSSARSAVSRAPVDDDTARVGVP